MIIISILNTRVRYQKVANYLIIILYKLTIDLIYKLIITKNYEYQGFLYEFSMWKYIGSMILFLIMIYPLEKLVKKSNASSMIIFMISIVYFIPGCTLYGLTGQSNLYFLYFGMYWMILLFSQYFIPQITISKIKNKTKQIPFHIIIFGFAIFSLLLSGIYTNFRISFDLSTIYDLRMEAREYNIPTVFKYVQNAAQIIIPIGGIYYIVSKNKVMMLLLIFVQVLNFSFNGKKSTLFILVLIILIGIFYNDRRKKWIIPAFLGLNILALFEFFIRGGVSEIANLIHRRVMFMPTRIAYHYFDFFSVNELDYLRQSILRWFGAVSPYSNLSIQRTIGLVYFGDVQNNANTGLVGDAFANFGWIGLILYPLMIVTALRILDYVAKDLDSKILAVLWILLFYTFISGSFFTILLNNGFIFACIVIYLCPRNNKYVN